jgi:hypothetical protein
MLKYLPPSLNLRSGLLMWRRNSMKNGVGERVVFSPRMELDGVF